MLPRSLRVPVLGWLVLGAGCQARVEGGGDDDGGDGGSASSSATVTSGSPSAGSGTVTDPLDCEAHLRCAADMGGEVRPCEDGGECTFVPGCVTAICVDADEACAATCAESACEILESYPEQIACEGTVTLAVDVVTCDEVMAELASIQSCTADEECGLVLGLSCGCTRDLVARLDASDEIFRALWEASTDCNFGGTCDCPEADGFACVGGVCSWRYTDGG